MSEATWAALGAILGGAGLKVIEHWLGRADRLKQAQANDAQKNWSDATAIRDELRKDMSSMRESMARQDAKITLLETAKNELEQKNEELEQKNEELERRITVLEDEKRSMLREIAEWKAKAEWPRG